MQGVNLGPQGPWTVLAAEGHFPFYGLTTDFIDVPSRSSFYMSTGRKDHLIKGNINFKYVWELGRWEHMTSQISSTPVFRIYLLLMTGKVL